jgi:hypothetical protein
MPDKNRYAAKFFGLPVEQVKFYSELTPEQKIKVAWIFNALKPDDYIYAIKRDGTLVSKREKRVPLMEVEGE